MTRLALAVLILCSSSVASAYVRSRTTHGTATAWRASCVLVQPDSTGTPDLDDATTFAAIQRSMQAWRDSVAACSFLTLDYVQPAVVDAHFDGLNVIKFRTDTWCHPDDKQSHGVCYEPVAAGITTVFYADHPGKADDGSMLDADVELNNVNFTFDVLGSGAPKMARSGTTVADLENTLVHELGHLQGLDHTCADSATPAAEVDEDGNRPPSCASLASLAITTRLKITEATMYNSAAPGETKKRSLSADDVAAICAAYPLASDPGKCKPADISGYSGSKAGCAVSGGRAGDLGALTVLALLALLLRRRPLAA